MKMTIPALLGRVLMSLGLVMVGVIPLLVDLTPTHVFNPAWPAHARLHEVWLLCTGALLTLVNLYFVWLYRERPRFGLTLAGVLGSALVGGFFIASATASGYGGVLVDPLTAPMMPNGDMAWGLPLNSVVFGVAWSLLLGGTVVARHATPASAA